jgi:hypothetical protein
MSEIWTDLDLRIARSLEEVARARATISPLLALRWRSTAGIAFRNSVIAFLARLDAVPRILEDARTAVQQGRAASLDAAQHAAAACRAGDHLQNSPHGVPPATRGHCR